MLLIPEVAMLFAYALPALLFLYWAAFIGDALERKGLIGAFAEWWKINPVATILMSGIFLFFSWLVFLYVRIISKPPTQPPTK